MAERVLTETEKEQERRVLDLRDAILREYSFPNGILRSRKLLPDLEEIVIAANRVGVNRHFAIRISPLYRKWYDWSIGVDEGDEKITMEPDRIDDDVLEMYALTTDDVAHNIYEVPFGAPTDEAFNMLLDVANKQLAKYVAANRQQLMMNLERDLASTLERLKSFPTNQWLDLQG